MYFKYNNALNVSNLMSLHNFVLIIPAEEKTTSLAIDVGLIAISTLNKTSNFSVRFL